METFEWIIVLLVCAAGLSALARRIGAPYPTLLAIGGVLLAFVPHAPGWTLDPRLALALFVAPVLVDAAYDTSLRDLRRNWRAVASLALAAVGVTTLAVALAARALVPGMSWPVAVVLGAIVAPPDAAAATAVMRQVALPHRLLKILEGESLLNDASALLIYRLAVSAVVAGNVSWAGFAPTLLLTLFGSVAFGIACAYAIAPLSRHTDDAPTSLVLQFGLTFGVWIIADRLGLSGILTLVVFAMALARSGGAQMRARLRIPVFAVWESVVFVLNAFAFVLIGMQLRPISERLGSAGSRSNACVFALVVLGVTVVSRFVWVMAYGQVMRMRQRRAAAPSPEVDAPPSVGGGLVTSWAGMRGIVTLAAAFAIPETLPDGGAFPYRDLILFSAFVVVFGTLVIQGSTLKPLIRWVGLTDDDPVGHEVRLARSRAYRAGLDAIQDDDTLNAKLIRKEYGAAIELNESNEADGEIDQKSSGPLRRKVIAVARDHAVALRRQSVIGDDAYRIFIQELDWAELSAGAAREE